MSKYDYDIAVVGGGAAGLTSAGICAAFGAKTALIEKHKLGGDCTWYGCVPSKSLLHIAKEISAIEKVKSLGVTVNDVLVDFKTVMESVRRVRQNIYDEADSPEVLNKRGVEVLTGTAQFKNERSIEITNDKGKRSISFRTAIITAGGSPVSLPIPGLEEAGFLTNETLFELDKLPEHLVILGAGPIGIEMAQAFRLLGSNVTMVALDERILIRDELKCCKVIKKRLHEQGVIFHLGETIHRVKKQKGTYELTVGPISGASKKLNADAMLIAVGRKPNLDDLNLDKAGVKFERAGIPVDRFCRTNKKHILAAGDITTFMKFTHVAENMAKTAAANAVLRLPLFKYEQTVIPWVTYTDPECAHVGKTAEELQAENVKFETIEFPYTKIDRAVTEHAIEGLIILHISKGKILGAHTVGAQAGEIIGEYTIAMKNRLKLTKISDTIHAYPTMLLGARRAADQFYVRMQKKWMSKLVRFVFRYKGSIPDYIGSKQVI